MTYEEYCETMENSNFLIDSSNLYDMKILEALEKQVAKKPSVQWNADRIYSWNACPICGRGIEEKYNHCPNCGQKIYF